MLKGQSRPLSRSGYLNIDAYTGSVISIVNNQVLNGNVKRRFFDVLVPSGMFAEKGVPISGLHEFYPRIFVRTDDFYQTSPLSFIEMLDV